MSDYNLIDEEWIPVLYQNGDYKLVGILTALTDAHKIRQIAASNPMDRVSLLRFLLAVLYWCRGNPKEEDKNNKQFPAEWFEKLKQHKHKEYFNLLGDGKRFYQEEGKNQIKTSYFLQII